MKPLFLPIDLVRHSETAYEFRLDSFKASFGDDPELWPDSFIKCEYLEWLRLKVEKDPFSVVHVWWNQEIIGQIEIGHYPEDPTWGYIYLYYLKPEFRGKNLGKDLEDFAARFFAQRGLPRSRLSVSPTNERALQFYHKNGWQDRGPRPRHPEVRLMEKKFQLPQFQAQFYFEAHQFLDRLFLQMKTRQIDIGIWEIDHLCYRTDSNSKYLEICREVSQFAQLLIESPVNGRLISTYKLSTPIFYRGQTIDLIEIPSPKQGKVTMQGFEHIEVIAEEDFSELQYRYSSFSLDVSGLRKEHNQELEIPFTDCALKFHPCSLESVIELEKNQKVFQALQKSRVLSTLHALGPLVSGTFPLGLGVENSDIDLLVSWPDLAEADTILRGALSGFSNFQMSHKLVSGQETIIAKFSVDEILFEVFCQTISPMKQNAQRHLLIEARLLKLLGEPLKSTVLSLKKSGLKTEPAFAKALDLSGDSYESLLDLSELSEVELRQTLWISL
jgi:predicted metalloenzyme YecM/ribosomal protein S18 acetylase RimI-like enzyme